MGVFYKIVDGNRVLGTHLCSQSVKIALPRIKNGEFWAYRGDTKKRPKAKAVRMIYVNGELK